MNRDTRDEYHSKNDSGLAVNRRNFIGVTTGIGAAMLAGCAGRTDTASTNDDSDGSTDTEETPEATVGTFRLLISDKPVAIDEFDSLDVSFDNARIFRAKEDEQNEAAEEDEETENQDTEEGETETEVEEAEEDEATEEETETEETETEEDEQADDEDAETEEDEDDQDDGQRQFFTVDLEGSTVDLTEVVGDKAVSVFEGELPEGKYTKIELNAADVDGIVAGESVAVKIPSGKLQIVKPFEVTAGESLSFVFDINVVKKGQGDEYNLLPVIAKSGVAGEDVDVEEIENESKEEEEEGEEEEDGNDEDAEEDTDQADEEEEETEAQEDQEDEEAEEDEEVEEDEAEEKETEEEQEDNAAADEADDQE